MTRESLLSVWARRLVTVPLYSLLALLLVVSAPAWAVPVFAVDLVTGQGGRCPRLRAMIFVTVYFVLELVGIVVAAFIWLATFGRGRFVALNEALQRWWTRAYFDCAVFIYGVKVAVEGAELVDKGPLLFFVRHTSVADAVLTAAIVSNPRGLNLRYVMKRQLTWDPCLDIVGRRLPNAFVDRKARRARADFSAIVQLARGLDERSAVLIYPEGTRFTPQKRTRAVETLRQRGEERLTAIADSFRHVLPPRLGGCLALINAAPSAAVIFIEHTGLEGTTTLRDFWRGSLVGATVRVRLRRFAPSDIPAGDRDLWLFTRWQEMDRWISTFT
jgi:1-acyl-sn-glycerol-3-phosphate acyltransferase